MSDKPEQQVRAAVRVEVERPKFEGGYAVAARRTDGTWLITCIYADLREAQVYANSWPGDNARIIYLPPDDDPPPVAMSEEMRKLLPTILLYLETGAGTGRKCLCGSGRCNCLQHIVRRQMAAAGSEVEP